MKYRILRKTGRLVNGYERDCGAVYHAVEDNKYSALCGAKPCKTADWSFHQGEVVTCPKCNKKIKENEAK